MLRQIYPAGKAHISGADAKSLPRAVRARGRNEPVVVSTVGDLPTILHHMLQDGDLLLLMGAGDIGHIAQHIAATNPIALDSSAIDPEVIAREKAVLAEKNAAGKPANVAEKIVEGGLKTFFKENCLVAQIPIHEDHGKKAIGQVAKEAGATIKAFVRFGLGEGVEKADAPDFAAEVAPLSKG